MTQLGFGPMLHLVSAGCPEKPSDFYGKEIVEATIREEALRLMFSDGSKIKIFDDGQSCCESRYMRTDDDVSSLIGHKLVRIEGKDGPNLNSYDDDPHETCFVEIATDAGFITITNHNEHNGYYGGFALSIEKE